ncbi:MAG: acetate--CoA ligase family protein [Methanomicrobiales archaeon]|jgi:succinyl-CoA synthetase beta subunit|nr:acetate--CoA ligase family protein [Methanomicrobiales archaeon]
MKLLEDEAKEIFRAYGIHVAKSIVLDKWNDESFALIQKEVGDLVVVKALVSVGGRGKAGGVLLPEATPAGIQEACEQLLGSEIKGVPVEKVLVEERLSILHECYVSITIDRLKKSPIILFADDGGVDIEELARDQPAAVRRAHVYPLCETVPEYITRYIVNQKSLQEISQDVTVDATMVAEIKRTVNILYQIFVERDCTLVEINPLVLTHHGVYAVDAKIILDDNALYRQDIACNRDLSTLEQEAEKYGFSFVELDGQIGVIGNGAGLTMATLDLIHRHGGGFGIRPANFLDVGGGADQDRVSRALQMLEQLPNLKVIVINLLGGITRCDEVAKGILAADLSRPIMIRLAGTNEEEGKAILHDRGYGMYQKMEDAIVAAVLHVQQEEKNREGCT